VNGSNDLEWLISVDDHILEPPSVWADRLPRKYAGVGPRIESGDDGEFWVYEDRRVATSCRQGFYRGDRL
jgi:hypothetical protein